jgi:hypothetical protein
LAGRGAREYNQPAFIVPQLLRRKENAVRGILPLVLLVAPVWVAPAVGQEARERKYRGRSLKFWVGQLQAQKAEDRDLAFKAITAFGAEGKAAAVPVLAEMLDDLCPEFQTFAAQSLGRSAPLKARAAVPALVKSLEDKRHGVRAQIAWALWRIAGHRAAIPVLLEGLRTEDKHDPDEWGELRDPMRDVPSPKMGFPGGYPGQLPGGKFDSLTPRGIQGHDEILDRLADIGPQAKVVIPDLEKILKDRMHRYRARAAWTLWKIAKHREAVPALAEHIQGLDDSEHPGPLNPQVLSWLEEIGPEAKAAVPALTRALEGRPGRERAVLLRVLGKIDPKAVPAAPQ